MNIDASEGQSHEPARRTPKIFLLGLAVIFLLAISVPCAWLYTEIVNFRDQGTSRELSGQKTQPGDKKSTESEAPEKSRQSPATR